MTFTFSGPLASLAGLRRCSAAPVLGLALVPLMSAPAWAQGQTMAAPQMLPPVYVTATRFVDDANTLPFGVRVISADDIRRSGAATVNEALMKLLGVPGRQDFYGGGDYALDLRGFGGTAGNNQVIVLDGVRLNEADLGGTRLAGIAIDTVERIEVVRGSGSVLYGEGAAGGVIVITTRGGSASARANSARVSGTVGSFGLRELRAGGSVAAGDFSLDVAAQRRLADNDRDNFKSDLTARSLSGQWRNDWLRVGLGVADDKLTTGLPGSLSAAQYLSNPRQTNTPNDQSSIDNHRSTVFGQATLGEWQLAVDAGWRDKSLVSVNSGFAYDYDVDASTQSARAKHTTTFSGLSNALVLGLDRGRWERKVVGGGDAATNTSRALYARDELTLLEGTRLSAGVRSESLRKANPGSTPVDERQRAWELGVFQPVADGASVYARVGKSFRLPNVDEFSFTSPGVPFRAQTSRDTELGARWAAGGRAAEARLYRSNLNDEIGYDPTAPNPYGGLGANINFQPTRRQGVEIEHTEPLAEAFTLHVNAALRRATFRAGTYDGKDVPLTPRRTLSLRGEWEPSDDQQIDVLLNHVGSQHPDFDNLCSMPAYTTLDLRYAYRWQHVELALGVTNAADRKYYTQAFSCNAGSVSSIYPEAGRALTASLRFVY
jgi:iron complex outermembrane recepter protein